MTLTKVKKTSGPRTIKVYEAQIRTSPQLRAAIKNVIVFNDEYKNAYFWTSRGNASARASQESKFEEENPAFHVITKKERITVIPMLRLSCKNVYYSLLVKRTDKDGDVKTSNISILNKFLKR